MLKVITLILVLVCSSTYAEKRKWRVVSLHPGITENLFALGLGSLVVGTSEFSDFPEEAKKIPRVGDSKPLMEKIISLKPDVVINMERDNTGIKETLEKAKIRFVTVRANTLSDFPEMIKTFGQLFERQESSHNMISEWDKSWNKIKSENPATNREVLIQVEQEPFTIAGGDTFLSEVVESCGFKNHFKTRKGYPQLSQEVILKIKPKLVLLLLPSIDLAKQAQKSKMWEKSLELYKTQFLFSDPNVLSRLTPRLPVETMKVCNDLRRI